MSSLFFYVKMGIQSQYATCFTDWLNQASLKLLKRLQEEIKSPAWQLRILNQ
jgi:hypothetical protein